MLSQIQVDPTKVKAWIEHIGFIILASLLIFLVGIRRNIGDKEKIQILTHCLNCVISILMGIIGSYMTDTIFEYFTKVPTDSEVVTIGGIIFALMSYSGFNWIALHIGGLVEKLIEKWIESK